MWPRLWCITLTGVTHLELSIEIVYDGEISLVGLTVGSSVLSSESLPSGGVVNSLRISKYSGVLRALVITSLLLWVPLHSTSF